MAMKTIQDLTNHMRQYKDAVVLLGPGAIEKIKPMPSKEEMAENYTAKALKRKPNEFWQFFMENIYINPEDQKYTAVQNDILKLYNKGLVNTLVFQTSDGLIHYQTSVAVEDMIHLHGKCHMFECQNPQCKITYTHQYVESFEDKTTIPTCEVCGKPIRPSVLLSGENYDQDTYNELRDKVIKTHTLIVVGLDYSEQPLTELIATYGDIKSMANAGQTKIKADEDTLDIKGERMLVVIHRPETELDINEIAFAEFLVKDDIESATARLLGAFNG